MSKDTIYRQDAIDAMTNTLWHYPTECLRNINKYEFAKGLAELGLKSVPSAQPTEASCWGCNCTKMERMKEQKTFSEMVHLHDAQTHDKRTETHGVCVDTISRQAAIELAMQYCPDDDGTCSKADEDMRNLLDELENLPSVQPEPLTDKEQRIFLAAMGREEKVCEEVDRNYVREPYEDSLMRVCKEIRRKVKGALWT